MIAITKLSTIFVVPNRGLYIYGGSGETRMQWLPSIAGSFSLDSNLYQSTTTQGVCSLQVSNGVLAAK
jgi:hypothetical protein